MAYAEAMPALKEAAEHDGSRHVKHRAELALGRFFELEFSSLESIKAWSGLDENTFRQAKVGQPAPDFTLRDVNGTAWRLSDFKGKSTVVLIWIFADWCPVCQHEFGDLTTMEKQFKEAGVQAFTIECHDPYRCNSMVAGRDLWWPHLVDIAGAVGATYGVDPMEFIVHDEWINRPSTIIVDRDGVVRFAYYGTYWGDRPTIEQTLEMIKTSSYSFRHPERRGESN
jgi:peroxiredoxin